MSVEAGDTFLREGSRKETQVGSNKRLWCFPAKKSIVREERRNELRPPPSNEGPLATPPFELNTAAISSPYPGADIACRGYNHKNLQTLTSCSNKAT